MGHLPITFSAHLRIDICVSSFAPHAEAASITHLHMTCTCVHAPRVQALALARSARRLLLRWKHRPACLALKGHLRVAPYAVPILLSDLSMRALCPNRVLTLVLTSDNARLARHHHAS